MSNKKEIDPRLFIEFSELIKQFYANRSGELDALGVKQVHSKIIHFLSDYDGTSQQEIATVAAVSRSTMSETLTEMVKAGYIERRSSKEDKRLSLIYLTPLGQEKADYIKVCFQEYCSSCLRNLSDEEIIQLVALLRKVQYR